MAVIVKLSVRAMPMRVLALVGVGALFRKLFPGAFAALSGGRF
jgi:hypothetical protein